MKPFFEKRINDFSVRKKFLILYLLCVLVPLFLTDAVIIFSLYRYADASRVHVMENAANAAEYSFYSNVEDAAQLGKSIYLSKYIDNFLNLEFDDPLDFVSRRQDFMKDTLLESSTAVNGLSVTMYTENDSIVNGGWFKTIESAREEEWYSALIEASDNTLLYFDYDKSKLGVQPERKMYLLKKLDLFMTSDAEKLLKITLNYSSVSKDIKNTSYTGDIYICCDGKIILSNGKYASVGTDYAIAPDPSKVGYVLNAEIYGQKIQIMVMKEGLGFGKVLCENSPIIFILFIVNIILPYIMIRSFNSSITKRITKLSHTFNDIDEDKLIITDNDESKDEIGHMMRSYNRMAARMNNLIENEYKNKLREQEMTVAKQNAELMALHSQINPHFLFNALESVRMHSLLRKEDETARMVEKLAVMQRQYADWTKDLITIEDEIKLTTAYLELQKYRFGERLSYFVDVEKECEKLFIPKMSIVTFVENACVHGIESKATPGWVFVRISREKELVVLEIEDTGSGMDEPQKKNLEEKMNNASMELLQKSERIGIINACLRIRIFTNNKVSFVVDSEEGTGLTVQIRIPFEYCEHIEREPVDLLCTGNKGGCKC